MSKEIYCKVIKTVGNDEVEKDISEWLKSIQKDGIIVIHQMHQVANMTLVSTIITTILYSFE